MSKDKTIYHHGGIALIGGECHLFYNKTARWCKMMADKFLKGEIESFCIIKKTEHPEKFSTSKIIDEIYGKD